MKTTAISPFFADRPQDSVRNSATTAGNGWRNSGQAEKSAPRLALRRELFGRSRTWVLAGLLLLVTVTVFASAYSLIHSQAYREAHAAASRGGSTNASLLSSEMQKFRLLPALLAEHPDVLASIRNPSPASIAKLDRELEALALKTQAADIYVMDRDGKTLAASNWKSENTFVGHNYAFRPYFTGAMAQGSSSYFALGTVSRRPGLYLASRVEAEGKAIGVVAIKVEFFEVERNWRLLSGDTMVLDSDGVVLMSSRPEWRLHSLGNLNAAALRSMEASARFPKIDISPLPLRQSGDLLISTTGKESYAYARAPMGLENWTIVYLLPVDPFIASERNSYLPFGFGLLVAILIAIGLVFREFEKRRIREHSLLELERQVKLRTLELEQVNATLQHESEEREKAVEAFRNARDALAQANRLSTLGAVTAAVAHEISQPVAAIRAYAENSSQFLARGTPEMAGQNLERIVGLTDRIGQISSQLRSFARRRPGEMEPCSLLDILQGALVIMGESLRTRGVTVCHDADELAAHRVKVVRMQMEQVLVNLLQNSLDALSGRSDGRIEISATRQGNFVRMRISDNGPGVPEAILDSLFAPFITTKPKGVGLGLQISRDIIRSLGGALQHRPAGGGGRGATFEIDLEAL